MFTFLLGAAFGAAGYWAWQSFGKDLLGMGDQGETSYGGFSSGTSSPPTSFNTPSSTSTPSSFNTPSSTSTGSGTTSNSDASSPTSSTPSAGD